MSGGLTPGLMDVTELRSCGITTAGQAYCWGGLLKAGSCAAAPQRGDGWGGPGSYPFCIPQPTRVPTPEVIPGGTSFATRGGTGECWLGQDGLAYCWGGHEGEAPQRVPGQ